MKYRGIEIQKCMGLITVIIKGRAYMCTNTADARWLIKHCVPLNLSRDFYVDQGFSFDQPLEGGIDSPQVKYRVTETRSSF